MSSHKEVPLIVPFPMSLREQLHSTHYTLHFLYLVRQQEALGHPFTHGSGGQQQARCFYFLTQEHSAPKG